MDVRGILERAGADADAPEGSQAWALAQVDAAVADLIEDRRLLADALSAVITMEVRGHQMQDRLQFSDTGRAILTKIDSARDAMAAALANVGGAK